MINYYKQAISLFFILISSSLFSQNEFITHWSAPMDTLITIPTRASSGPYNYTVSWQSLNTPTFNGSASGLTGNYVIPNVLAGEVIEVKISGVFPHFYMRYGDQRNFLTKVTQWGNNPWKSMEWAFEGCEKMILTATDVPDLALVTNMDGMFSGCKLFNQPINNWNVSTVTSMRDLFSSDSLFNQPLDNWNVSNVTRMDDMFSKAFAFNQSLTTFDVSNVTSMQMMFAEANSFNQPLNGWDVSQVTNMYGMFNGAVAFNQPLNNWVVSNVVNMAQMFLNTAVFNQSLTDWNVSNVTRMNEMFKNAVAFNGSVSDWDVSSVEYMYEMFRGATSFNKPVNTWNVANVTTMNKMFNNASSFDQAINNWDIISMTNMTDMLSGATSLSYCHYDDALIAWKALPTVPTVITFGAMGVKHTVKAQSARNLLTAYHGWTITDGGIMTGVEVDATASNTGFCVGNSSVINATSNMPGTTYSWNEGLPAGASHTVIPLITTNYIVTGTDALGCQNSDSIKVIVNQLPTILLQANETTICERDSVTLTVTGGNDYFWNESLNPVASNKVAPVISTEYIVIGIDVNGCENSDTLFINVNAAPNVNLQANNTAICVGESVSLTASGADSYTWNQALPAGTTQNPSPTINTKYIVTGTDLDGCKNSDSVTIVVNELPVVILQANKTTICNGHSVNLVASGAATYTWNNGLTPGATKTASPTSTTSYIVVGEDANGCTDSDTILITVEPCLGVNEVETVYVNVYPNPARETITLKGEDLAAKFHTIYVLDITGKILQVSPISQSEETLSVINFENGIYFINLVGAQNKTFKIEVKH